MEKVIFTIDIEGDEAIKRSLVALQTEQKKLQKELSNTAQGTAEYAKLAQKLADVQTGIKSAQKEQKAFVNSLKQQTAAAGSYEQLNAQLSESIAKFKALSKAEREGETGEALRKSIKETNGELKRLDAELGNFQRNVGDYENAINRAFGNSKIGKRISAISDQLGGFGDAFASLGLAGAVAGALIKAGQVIAAFADEYNKAAKTVQAASKTTGDALAENTTNVLASSKTFEVSADKITEAAKSLSKSAGIDFAQALELVNQGLINGQTDAEGYLDEIIKGEKAFSSASDAVGDYAEKNRQAFESNKLAVRAQAELAGAFNALSEELQPLTNFLKALLGLVGFALVQAFRALLIPINFTFDAIRKLGEGIVFLKNSATDFIGLTSKAEREALAAAKQNDEARLKLEEENIRRRAELRKKATEQLKKDFSDSFFENLSEAQKKAFEGIVTSTNDIALVQGKDTGEAYAQAYAEGLKALGKLGVDVQTEEQKKIEQAASEQAKQAAQKRLEERRALLEREKELERERALALLSIANELLQAQISNITNEFDQRRAQLKAGFESEKQSRKTSLQDLQAQEAEFLAETARLFGKSSKEYQAAKKKSDDFVTQNQKAANDIILQLEIKLQNDLLKVDEDADKLKADSRAEELQQILKDAKERTAIELDEQKVRNERFIQEQKKLGTAQSDIDKFIFEQRRNELTAQLEALNEEERVIRENGIEEGENVERQRILTRERINTQLLALDNEQQQKSLDQIKAAQKKEAEEWKKKVDSIAGFINQGLKIFADFANAIDEQQIAKIEEREERQANLISNLEGQIEQATGLERRRLELQLEAEKETALKIAEEKEKAEKDRAKRAKGIAIAESLINTAVAITKALPNLLLAGIVGAFGLAQTGVIAAQKLATGGQIESTPASGGRITARPNTRPTALGDNVMIHARVGEWVLTEQQVENIGLANLRNAGVPMPNLQGLATGGRVVNFPNTAGFVQATSGGGFGGSAGSNMGDYTEQILIATQRMINNQISITQPVVAVQNIQDVAQRNRVINNAGVI